MARWIPPIPKAAMYRTETIRLGDALPLLFYCYDYVERSGWVNLKLSVAADAMQVPYPTIKHWWQTIEKVSGLFDHVIRRGRAGLRIHFAPDWLDWSMPTGWQYTDETGSESVPNTDTPNGHETGVFVIPNTGNGPENGIVIGRETGSESYPNNPRIGTHRLRSSTDDDMRDSASQEDAPNDQDQQSSSSVVSQSESEHTRTARRSEEANTNGRSESQPPSVPPVSPTPPDAYALLWAALGPDEREWIATVCTRPTPTHYEQRRLRERVERHGLPFVVAAIVACVTQGGKSLSYLDAMCNRCEASGKLPGPRAASNQKKRDASPMTEAELIASVRRRCASYDISAYHGGSSRGSYPA